MIEECGRLRALERKVEELNKDLMRLKIVVIIAVTTAVVFAGF